VHKRANPNKQSTVLKFCSLDSKGVNTAIWGIWEMHNNLCQKTRRKESIWEKYALTLTFEALELSVSTNGLKIQEFFILRAGY